MCKKLILLTYLILISGLTTAQAQESYIIVHTLNPEGVEIASIMYTGLYSVEIYDDTSLIGYGPTDIGSHNVPIPIVPGIHTIKAKFNGMSKEQAINLNPGETKVLTFTFDRTEFDCVSCLDSVGTRVSNFSRNFSSSIWNSYGWLYYDDGYVDGPEYLAGAEFANVTMSVSGSAIANVDSEGMSIDTTLNLDYTIIDPSLGWWAAGACIELGSCVFIVYLHNEDFDEWFVQGITDSQPNSAMFVLGSPEEINGSWYYVVVTGTYGLPPGPFQPNQYYLRKLSSKLPSYIGDVWPIDNGYVNQWIYRCYDPALNEDQKLVHNPSGTFLLQEHNVKMSSVPYDLLGTGIHCEVNTPIVSTSPASDVTNDSATLSGSVTDDGGEACQYRFRYREENGDYIYTSWSGSVTSGDPFSETIGGLNPDTTYYFNAQGRNSAGESAWGNEQSFVAQSIHFEIKKAEMVSPDELGIGIEVEYPQDSEGTTRNVKFSAIINGCPVEKIFDITQYTKPGVMWGGPGQDNQMFDINGNLKPTTPLKINLSNPDGDPKTNDSIPKFIKNKEFKVVGVAYSEDGQSKESEKEVEILLPVVVLHGYIHQFGFEPFLKEYVGYPIPIPFFGAPMSFEVAYKGLHTFLLNNGYQPDREWEWEGGKQYKTLWDPSDFQSSMYNNPWFAQETDILSDVENLLAIVFEYNYAGKVNFIGHSFGGLVARYYTSVMPEKVNVVITVGTPHNGVTFFYETAFSRNTKAAFEEEFTRHAGMNCVLRWVVPTYDSTYLKDKNTIEYLDPVPVSSLFENTLTAGQVPDIKYYSIYGSGYNTDKKIFLFETDNDWYERKGRIEKGPGDGYILAESASAFGTPCFPIPRGKNATHAILLNDETVQKQILELLQEN